MKRILSIVLTLALLLTALPLALSVSAAETTTTYTFGSITDSSATDGEKVFDENLTIGVTNGFFTTQLRIYANTGVAIFKSHRIIKSITLNAGNKSSTLAVSGSTNGIDWTDITTLTITSSYADVTVSIPDGSQYTQIRFANGGGQVRVKSATVTFGEVYSEGGSETPTCEHTNTSYVSIDETNHKIVCDDCSVTLKTEGHNFVDGACFDCGQDEPQPEGPTGENLNVGTVNGNSTFYSVSEIVSANGAQGEQYADETYILNDTLSLNIVKCHLHEDGELRIYSSSTNPGVVTFISTKVITSFTVNAGNKVDNLVVYGKATEAEEYENLGTIAITSTSYNDYTFNIENSTYTYIQLDVEGSNQIRIKNFTIVTADEATACTHENKTTTNTATYFKDGKVTVVCDDCDETVSETEASASDVALDEENCKEEFANGNLTITLTYSEALIKDIQNGAVISFNYSIGEYSNSIEIPTGIAAVITLEGFNVDRLNAELTYYLTAKYDGVDTTKLAGDTTNSLKVSEKIDANSEIGVLMNALKTEANTVVSTKIDATTHFAENTITADLKEGTMVLNFIASDALVAKLTENKAYTRTNKITVTIDGVANKYEFTPDVMRKSTTINISGMSFEQLNGTVTVKVEFIYNNANVEDITDTITFEGAKAVEATDSAVATAFKNYIAK